jgi:hypothetical protein
MAHELRTSTFARIGRSYPRPLPELPAVAARSWMRRIPAHLHVTGGVIALLAALGLVGWLLAS